ncbi:general stress protein [Mammaliicoccus vitulinus]|uniref:general stress protein n=1 Tax=Mammaliicoccus vitulinus TaxID=71237 RepID=UPI003BA26F7D
MNPVVKLYSNEKYLEADFNTLRDTGIRQKGIYILSSSEEHIEEIINQTELDNINCNKKDVDGDTYKQDGFLRKLEILNLKEVEAEKYIIKTLQRIVGVFLL